MKPLLLLIALSGAFETHFAFAQPVWDPTEIARLSEQAAQLGINLAALIDNLQAFDKLAAEVGALGTRPASVLQPSSTMVGRLNLPSSSSMPSGNDALALTPATTMTASQLQSSRQVWGSAYQSVTAEGFSLAEVANQDLASANARSKSMGEAAGAAQDLRDDVQANSAVCLAVLTELGSVQAVLSLLLEQQSLARLSSAY